MSSQPAELARLAAFQATMLTTLHAGHDPDAMRASLLRSATDPALAEYVCGFDDRMLIVAAELVRKWGVRPDAEPTGHGDRRAH